MVYTYEDDIDRLTDQSKEDFFAKADEMCEAYIARIIAKRKASGLETESLNTFRRMTSDKLMIICEFD